MFSLHSGLDSALSSIRAQSWTRPFHSPLPLEQSTWPSGCGMVDGFYSLDWHLVMEF